MVRGSSSGVYGRRGGWLVIARGQRSGDRKGRFWNMMQLRGLSYIRKLSYRPLTVRDIQEEGVEIMDIQTGRVSELGNWAKHYVKVMWPCFAAKSGKDGLVKLWVRRTVDHEGVKL